MPNLPEITVVIATYGRGGLIETTLASVAAQSFRDFEVLVVSDGPAADGLPEIVAQFGERFRLLENNPRARSQSGPNNVGWAVARGKYVSYLGHDDLWHPEHLARLVETFIQHPEASIAVSGCIYFGPLGATKSYTWVTGIFDSTDATVPRDHFFPPSSFAHIRELPAEIPRWEKAEELAEPVDVRFLRAAEANGLRFASTGTVTVFKFASALRYLSYLSPDDEEQRATLARMRTLPKFDQQTAQTVARARREGRFMPLRYDLAEVLPPGEHLRRAEQARGLDAATLTVLESSVWLEPGSDRRGFDWHEAEFAALGGVSWRWSGPSDHPRLRIPVVGGEPVRFSVYIGRFADDDVRTPDVVVNGASIPVELARALDGFALTFTAPLLNDRASIVEFRLSRPAGAGDESEDPGNRGFCLLGTWIELVSEPTRTDTPEEAAGALEGFESVEPRKSVFGVDILLARAERNGVAVEGESRR